MINSNLMRIANFNIIANLAYLSLYKLNKGMVINENEIANFTKFIDELKEVHHIHSYPYSALVDDNLNFTISYLIPEEIEGFLLKDFIGGLNKVKDSKKNSIPINNLLKIVKIICDNVIQELGRSE